MIPYKLIEHTADVGIEVVGNTLEELFVNAARGTIDLVVEKEAIVGENIEKISLKSDIKEQLLVEWLEELLYLFEIKRQIPIDFRLNKITETEIDAEIAVVPFDPAVHTLMYQIKAVTYHDLAIKDEDGYFSTTIIFDI